MYMGNENTAQHLRNGVEVLERNNRVLAQSNEKWLALQTESLTSWWSSGESGLDPKTTCSTVQKIASLDMPLGFLFFALHHSFNCIILILAIMIFFYPLK